MIRGTAQMNIIERSQGSYAYQTAYGGWNSELELSQDPNLVHGSGLGRVYPYSRSRCPLHVMTAKFRKDESC